MNLQSYVFNPGHRLVLMVCLMSLVEPGYTESKVPSPEPGGTLTLSQALSLALDRNPDLLATSAGAQAMVAAARQSRAIPNPELELEAEEFGGEGLRKGYDGAKTTLRLSQELEPVGRRGSRQRLAATDARLAGLEYESTRLDVVSLTQKAYIDVLLGQGQLELAESLLAVALDVQQATSQRVKAGKVPSLEEARAGVEVANARLARAKACRELDLARNRLVALWGGAPPAFKNVSGSLEPIGELPPVSELIAAQDKTPDVARGSENVARGRDELTEARSKRLPGLRVSAGLSRFEDDGSHAGIVSLALPLPLFDRNTGGITAAGHGVSRAEHQQRALLTQARTELLEACTRCEAAREEVRTLRTELLPAAQQTFDAAQLGYQAGKFGHLEVLDAQRMLGEARIRTLNGLAEYQKAMADVERLSGRSLIRIQ